MTEHNLKNNSLPVGNIKIITKYPEVRLTNRETTLSEFSDKICVVHLYTG